MNANRKVHSVTVAGESAEVATANELAIVLDVLHGKEDRVVLEQLGPALADVLDSPVAMIAALKSLAPDDQRYVFQAIGPRLAEILREGRHLRDVLATLAVPEVEEELLRAIGAGGLRRLIQTAEELAEVLEWVYGHCDELPLELLGDQHVDALLRNGYELSLVLHALRPEAQGRLLERLGFERVSELIRDGRDLAHFLRALPAENSIPLLERYDPPKLAALIGNREDWRFLFERMEPAEAEYVISRLGLDGHAA